MGRADAGGEVLRLRAERLRFAVGKVGAKRAAAEAGVPYTTVRDAMSGGDMRLSTAAALARVCGVTVDWIANGEGEPPDAPPIGPHGPVVDAGGAAVGRREPVGMDWLADRLALPVTDLIAFPVLGDAMEPTLRDGDLLVAHRLERAVIVPAIYAIEVGGTVIARRLEQRLDGNLVVTTDNVRYEAQLLQVGEKCPFRIVGPVVWRGGPVRD